jgi:hypothetical protein
MSSILSKGLMLERLPPFFKSDHAQRHISGFSYKVNIRILEKE